MHPELPLIRVLLVDDEPALLFIMGKYLTRRGYDVVSCDNMTDAMRETASSPFAVAVVDLSIDGAGGEELARQILQQSEGTAVIVCSGYAFDINQLPDPARARYLQKPFRPETLVEAVTQLVTRKKTSSGA